MQPRRHEATKVGVFHFPSSCLRVFVALLLGVWLLSPAVTAQSKRLPPPAVRYVPSPQSVVDAMLELAHVTSADIVYDLGSGDGRIPITAARRYGARGVGIEIEPRLVAESRESAIKAGVADRVWFVNDDLF